jgi:hypothetical protein
MGTAYLRVTEIRPSPLNPKQSTKFADWLPNHRRSFNGSATPAARRPLRPHNDANVIHH